MLHVVAAVNAAAVAADLSVSKAVAVAGERFVKLDRYPTCCYRSRKDKLILTTTRVPLSYLFVCFCNYLL